MDPRIVILDDLAVNIKNLNREIKINHHKYLPAIEVKLRLNNKRVCIIVLFDIIIEVRVGNQRKAAYFQDNEEKYWYERGYQYYFNIMNPRYIDKILKIVINYERKIKDII
jgi:hypothetical protein